MRSFNLDDDLSASVFSWATSRWSSRLSIWKYTQDRRPSRSRLGLVLDLVFGLFLGLFRSRSYSRSNSRSNSSFYSRSHFRSRDLIHVLDQAFPDHLDGLWNCERDLEQLLKQHSSNHKTSRSLSEVAITFCFQLKTLTILAWPFRLLTAYNARMIEVVSRSGRSSWLFKIAA